MPFSGI